MDSKHRTQRGGGIIARACEAAEPKRARGALGNRPCGAQGAAVAPAASAAAAIAPAATAAPAAAAVIAATDSGETIARCLLRRLFRVPDARPPPPQDNRGTLFIGSWSEHAFAFNATTGAQIWSFDTQGEVESHGAWVDGTVYFSAEESRTLFAINARTAQPLWQWSGSSQELNGSPTLTPTLVFVGSNDHSMHCLRRSDGKHLFAVQAAANVFASAAVADDGWVFFADNTATLDDIRAQNSDMMVAAERCAGDADCALAGARAVWSRSLDAERGSGRLGNVYAINPSLHL